jgi:hypothetical protein
VATLAAALVGCGQASGSGATDRAEAGLKECRAQWRQVGETVMGLDQDTNPSNLAARWNSVIATIDYYQTSGSSKNCQQTIENQLRAITALREFSAKLQPYDMTYQRDQLRAAVDLYLNDPLPAAVRGDDGARVKPPTKEAVSAAMQTLTANAEEANVELQPAWAQTSSVDLTDVDALTTTMHDLDFLAQDSPHWRACEEALQVLVAAIRAQEGLSGSTAVTPSSAPTDRSSPSASP